MKPRAGLRVPDLSRVLAGPFRTALPDDPGAWVIKQGPPAGDDPGKVQRNILSGLLLA